MSQSPTQLAPSEASERYFTNWNKLGAMVSRGASFSGRERNRCFLNTTGLRFADVSAISGLDHIDDGRGIGVVDWDHDGDLDLWISNRTGPRVRMLRNDFPRTSRFVAFRLQGTTCNRDAIGARVRVKLRPSDQDRSPRERIRTLRAGEGFLSQSSKWLHFGLGTSGEIERVQVFWPGQSTPQVFDGIEVNRRYRLTQGEPAAVRVQSPVRGKDLIAKPASAAPHNAHTRTLLTKRIALPEISYRDLQRQSVKRELPRGPLLINVWASWCAPCLRELSEWTRHETALRDKGLRILALSVDEVDRSNPSADGAALEVVGRLGFPFEAAAADRELLVKLTELTHAVFYPQDPLSLPCSFLIDGSGRLAAFYRGSVSAEQLISDVDLLSANEAQLAKAASPFAGRRLLKRHEPSPLGVAKAYLEGGYLMLARQHALEHLKEVSAEQDFDRLAEILSHSIRPGVSRRPTSSTRPDQQHNELLIHSLKAEQRRLQIQALRLLADIEHRRASPEGVEHALVNLLELDPQNHRAQGELFVALETQGKKSSADLILDEIQSHAQQNVPVLLMLGQCLMQVGRGEEGVQCFESAVRRSPESVEARFNLAMARQLQEQPRQAVEHYRWILDRQPDHHEALNNLAWLYATAPPELRDPATAVRLARRLCQITQFGSAAYLDTLGTALAESGELADATKVMTTAYQLARGRGETQLANRMKQRLTRLRSGRSAAD